MKLTETPFIILRILNQNTRQYRRTLTAKNYTHKSFQQYPTRKILEFNEKLACNKTRYYCVKNRNYR